MDEYINKSTICAYSTSYDYFTIFYKYNYSIQSKTLLIRELKTYDISEELYIGNFEVLYEAYVTYGNLTTNNICVIYEYYDFIIYAFDGTNDYYCDNKQFFKKFEKLYTSQNLNFIEKL